MSSQNGTEEKANRLLSAVKVIWNKIKNFYIDANDILPITTFSALLGAFFMVFSVVYVFIQLYVPDVNLKTILLCAVGVLVFVLMFITLFFTAIKKHNEHAQEKYRKDAETKVSCAKAKMADGFHYYGLVEMSELLKIEKSLKDDTAPKNCEVLVYTSDLASEKNAAQEVKDNIKAKVKYKVLYFDNTCTEDEMLQIQNDYGEENLKCLRDIDEFSHSFDGKLAKTLGFDIMIYCRSNGAKEGFFAVDFVPEGSRSKTKECHDPNCKEKCRWGRRKEGSIYKRISQERTDELYYAIKNMF